VKVYYATQIDTKPPTIILFVNNPDLITEEYRRFFVRQLRERLPFSEVPIRLYVRGHHRSFEKAEEKRRPAVEGTTARPVRSAQKRSKAEAGRRGSERRRASAGRGGAKGGSKKRKGRE